MLDRNALFMVCARTAAVLISLGGLAVAIAISIVPSNFGQDPGSGNDWYELRPDVGSLTLVWEHDPD